MWGCPAWTPSMAARCNCLAPLKRSTSRCAQRAHVQLHGVSLAPTPTFTATWPCKGWQTSLHISSRGKLPPLLHRQNTQMHRAIWRGKKKKENKKKHVTQRCHQTQGRDKLFTLKRWEEQAAILRTKPTGCSHASEECRHKYFSIRNTVLFCFFT